MPCSEPAMTDRDNRCYTTCELINTFAVLGKLADNNVPKWITNKNYIYPMGNKLDEAAALLCAFCRVKTEDWIYGDARDRDRRHLADWWEDHKMSEGHG